MTLGAQVQLERGSLALRAELFVGDGETVAILGPNAAGKTTLLRSLAGLLRADVGRVELDGKTVEDTADGTWVPSEGRRVAMVFQDHRLFPHLSAVDNVAFGLRARGVRTAAARRRAGEWLERLEVSAAAAGRAESLSGGQAQRVALARALITEPRLLLLDEPLASVDAPARLEFRRVLRAQLAAHPGMRLLVTHDPVEAGEMADRVVILEAGHVVQQGTLADVTARPRSPWVARVAGLNLLSGVAVPGSLMLANGSEIRFAGDVRGPALATIHPRAISIHRSHPEGSPRNVLAATVGEIDSTGHRWRVGLGGRVPLVAEVSDGAVTELRLAEGGSVFAAVKATDIDVYAS